MSKQTKARHQTAFGISAQTPPKTASANTADNTVAATASAETATTPAAPTNSFTALMEKASQEILTLNYWFEAQPLPEPYSVVIKFTGTRNNIEGKPGPRDTFTHFETIDEVPPNSGSLSVTAHVDGINPGEWTVTAQVADLGKNKNKQGIKTPPADLEIKDPLARIWHTWAPSSEKKSQVKTGFLYWGKTPGIIPGAWPILVTLGIIAAILLQTAIMAHEHIVIGSRLSVTFFALIAGIIGGKGWFILKHWRDHRWEGWTIQGFVFGIAAALLLLLPTNHISLGSFLDPLGPSLLIGIGIGRLGCFFAGCCGGPLTCEPWGVWSSDQRIGGKRVPTQLMESSFAFITGFAELLLLWQKGPANGAFFAAAIAVYALGRQGILRMRQERNITKWDNYITGAIAVIFVISLIFALK